MGQRPDRPDHLVNPGRVSGPCWEWRQGGDVTKTGNMERCGCASLQPDNPGRDRDCRRLPGNDLDLDRPGPSMVQPLWELVDNQHISGSVRRRAKPDEPDIRAPAPWSATGGLLCPPPTLGIQLPGNSPASGCQLLPRQRSRGKHWQAGPCGTAVLSADLRAERENTAFRHAGKPRGIPPA